MKEHELKTWPDLFWAIDRGDKRFEIRRTHDRYFDVGDVLVLRLWSETLRTYLNDRGRAESRAVNAATLRMRVTYILRSGQFGVPDGYCVMSIAPI